MASKIQPWHSFANHTFSRLANAYWATNKPDQALRALARAEELGLRHPELTFIKANVYLQKKDFHKAIKLFKDTIELGKQQNWDGDARICGFKSQFGLASAYLGIGDYENAIKHAHNTMNEYPEHPQAPEVLALAYDALKQYENAENTGEWSERLTLNIQCQ